MIDGEYTGEAHRSWYVGVKDSAEKGVVCTERMGSVPSPKRHAGIAVASIPGPQEPGQGIYRGRRRVCQFAARCRGPVTRQFRGTSELHPCTGVRMYDRKCMFCITWFQLLYRCIEAHHYSPSLRISTCCTRQVSKHPVMPLACPKSESPPRHAPTRALDRSCTSCSVVRVKGCSYDLNLLLILQRIVVSQTGPTARI